LSKNVFSTTAAVIINGAIKKKIEMIFTSLSLCHG
jgi:hypothetical protein